LLSEPVKKRFLYVLLFSVPILLASTVAAFVVFGAAAGFMWLFVAGDATWPAATDTILIGLFVLAFAGSALALGYRAYAAGREREDEPSGSVRPALVAGGTTVLLLLAIVSYQWRVGNLGPKIDSVVCSEFCASKGFMGSSMPPRDAGAPTCTCVDAQGREGITVPMGELEAMR
jgi:hypothetical protein